MAAPERRYGCSACKAVFRSGFARCPLDGTPLQQISDDPLAGSIFVNRYVIDGLVGEGAMGRVYRAQHRRMSRKFAIKVLFGDHATDPKMRERFGREAEAASRLSHANVISVMDFGETDEGLLYLVMEYVDGRELADIVDSEAPLAPERIRRMVRQLCLGLGHAHDQGLVHRDFKAANVIISGTGDQEVCKIVDFGIAVLQEASGGAARLTTEGIVLGTPAYMSPEQATGQELDLRTDLFSLGVLIYELLCGVLPFEGPPVAIARQNLAVEPPRIAERVPGLQVDPELEAIAHRLMAKKRQDRYQSAAEVLAVLDKTAVPVRAGALPSAPVAAPAARHTPGAIVSPAAIAATGRAVDVQAPPPRRRTGLLAGIAIAVLLLGVAGYVVLRSRGDSGSDAREASAAPPPAAPDAGPVARAAPVDAAPVIEPVNAGTTVAITDPGKPNGKNPKRPVRDAGVKEVKPPPVTPPDAAPTPQITVEGLTKLYVSVGSAVDKLERTRGGDVARPFRETYLSIPFPDAQRNPSMRREVEASLRKLRGELARQLQ